jgi:hypothetical protein
MTQDARSKMHDAHAARAFVQAFMAETQPIAHPDAVDEAVLIQMAAHAAEPSAAPSADVVRRLITRVECLA